MRYGKQDYGFFWVAVLHSYVIVLDVRIRASLPHLEWKNRIVRPKEVQRILIAGGGGEAGKLDI